MRVDYKIFRGTLVSWSELFREAAEFSSKLLPEQIISISHSADQGNGVVTVWFWSDLEIPVPMDPEAAQPS
jgi:hypothetical protein